MTSPQIILASGSPRRKVLLGLLVDWFDVQVPDVDESFPPGDVGQAMEAVAARKADAITRPEDGVVLAADTAVFLGDDALGKAKDASEARAMLESLNGRQHHVITAVAVHGPHGQARFHVTTKVRLDLPPDVLDAYLETGGWQGKAGAYGAQDAPLTEHVDVDGSWSNVVGLPLHAVHQAFMDQRVACRHPPSEEALRMQNPF